jgi:hypothetical protein
MKNKNILKKKIKNSFFIFIILLFTFYNFLFVFSLEEDYKNNPLFSLNTSYKCIDLDKNNPYLKSYTYLIDNKLKKELETTRIWDSCINSSFLNESSCNIHENQISLILNCPYGCEEGVCLPPNKNKSLLKPIYSYSCYTNNIKDTSKFFKGTSIFKNTTTIYDFSYDFYTQVEDYCKDDKILVKYFCDNNQLIQKEIKCPSSCKNGACTFENSFDFFVNNLSFNKLKDIRLGLEMYSLNYCLGFSSKGKKINYSDLLQTIVNVKVEFFTSSNKKNHSQEFWPFSPSIYNNVLEGNLESNPTIFKDKETFYVDYDPSSVIKNSKLVYKINYSVSPNEFCFFIIGDKKVFFNNNLYGFSFPNSLLENSILFDLSDSEKNVIKLIINGDNKIFEENTKNNFKEIIFDPKEESIFYDINSENFKTLPYSDINSKSECLNGCLLNNICYPIGFRNDLNYCSGDDFSFHLQKDKQDKCNNNFECKSNLCLNQKCFQNLSLFEKILNFLKNFSF